MQRLVIPVLAVVAFGAGFGARMWTEGGRALPPPPSALGAEFVRGPVPEKKNGQKPYDRAELVAEIERLRPQIDAYRVRVEALDAEFEQGFAQILNDEQKCIYDEKQASAQKRRAQHEAKLAAAPPPPLSDEEIAKLRQRPFETAFWKISFVGRLEMLTRDYKLDAAQQTKVRDLLVARRDKFVALVDSTPSPSFKLTSLAVSVQRLVDQPSPNPAAPAK
ncbi:MAG TPA: hypothetical protein VHO24_04365 [Opitutaceae bacterium]|nr:hypothetical protein [Opitutaceae bacterium]